MAVNGYSGTSFINYFDVNKRYIRDGIIAWGSKEIPGADLLKGIEQIYKKKDFNKLHNPEDLIRIALFDLWVDNADRHSGNYNLLVKSIRGQLQFFAIDHAFTFGGLKGMSIFHEKSMPSSYHKLIDSQYFIAIMTHINKKQRIEIARHFVSLITQLNLEKLINEVFSQIPDTWGIGPALKTRIVSFLQSKGRLDEVEQICQLQLQKNFRRIKS